MDRRRAAVWLAALCCCLCAGALQAATVSRVQTGTLTSAADGTETVALAQTVNPATSALFFSTRHNADRPGDSTVRGRLADAGTLEFVRVTGGGGDVDIHWYLVEFASGVRVQRGQVDQTNTTLDVPLAQPVASTAQSFLLYSKTPQAADTEWGSNDPIGGYIRNASSLRFRADTAANHVIDYQVVEFTDPTDLLVQSGETNVSGTATTIDVSLPQPVDPARTFVLAGHTISNGSSSLESRLLRAEVLDADTVRFSRGDDGNSMGQIVWQVIELRDGARVMHGTESFSWSGAETVSLPGAVDTSRAIAFSGVQSYGGQSMGSTSLAFADDIPGISSFAFDLSADALEIERNTFFSTASVGWFVVEFNAPPLVPVLDVRMDESAWSGVSGEVTDQVAGNNGTAFNGAATQGADPAIDGSPGTCRYGEFDGSDDYAAFADAAHLDLASELTVAIWINTRTIPGSGLKSIVSKDTNYEFHVNDSGQIYGWWNDSSGNVRSFNSGGATVSVDTWHHVAITYASGSQVIYLDGAPVASASHTGSLATNGLELQVGQDQGFIGRFWDGRLDELKIYDQVLDQAEIQTVMNETRPCQLQPVGDWHFDETGWNGTAGEVADYSGNEHHGTATNTVTEPGVLCRAADLGATGTSDWLELDAAAFDGLEDFTLAAWYRGTDGNEMTMVSAANGSEDEELLYYFRRPDRFDPHLLGGQGADVTPGTAISDGAWHFLAWTRSGADNCLHVDGALAGCRGRDQGAVSIAPGGVVVGQKQAFLGGGFDGAEALDGELDEMLLFDQALSAADLATIRNNHLAGLNWDGTPRTCPAAVVGYVIDHDGAGIHCTPEAVQVTAVDALGAAVTEYAGEITLDTSTSRGSWSLISGSGTLTDATADDGLATYVFDPADDGVATFSLSYPEGPETMDGEAYQSSDTTIRDDDTEGPLTFAPSGFTLTANPLPNPPPSPIADPIPTQVAGSSFPVHITAYGTTEDDPQCGVIENYTGARNLAFDMVYADPGPGPGPVTATVDGQPAGSGSPQAVSFTSGQAQVSVRYKDAGAIGLTVADSSSFPNVLNGGTNNFVVQPFELVISRIESTGGAGNLGAGTSTGPGFVRAGELFEVDVEARDADGDITPSFGLESSPESVRVTLVSISVPAGGAGNLTGGAAFGAASVPGRFSNANVAFDEVGVIELTPEVADGDFLGTGPIPGVTSGPVGRFFPAAFDLASASVTPACGSFTYLDQPALGLQYRLQALNVGGNVTRNYDVALLGTPAAVADVEHVAEAADAGVDLGGRLSPVGGGWVAGEVVVNRSDLIFARLAAPDGPHDPLQIGVVVTDNLDGVPLLGLDMNPTTGGDCVAAANCSARRLGAAARMVYGRLAVLPTSGPENENLRLPLAAQIFTGAAFEHHTADVCSTYDSPGVTLAGYSGNLSAGETSVIGPTGTATLTGGVADPSNPPVLAAPGFGNDGSVDVTLNVEAWLEFDWLGSGAADPTATASFGRFRGHDRIIYWGEPR